MVRVYFQAFRLLFLAMSLYVKAWVGRERRAWLKEKKMGCRQSQPAPSDCPCMRSYVLLQGLCLRTLSDPSPRGPASQYWLWGLQAFRDTNNESSGTTSRVGGHDNTSPMVSGSPPICSSKCTAEGLPGLPVSAGFLASLTPIQVFSDPTYSPQHSQKARAATSCPALCTSAVMYLEF